MSPLPVALGFAALLVLPALQRDARRWLPTGFRESR